MRALRRIWTFGLVAILFASLAVTACEDERGDGGEEGEGEGEGEALELTQQEASLTTVQNIRTNFLSAARSMEFMAETELASAVNDLSNDDDVRAPSPAMPRSPAPAGDEGEAEAESRSLEDEVAEIVDWLEEHVFTEAESEDGTSVTYRLGPELCEELAADDSSGGIGGDGRDDEMNEGPQELDDEGECRDFLERFPLRIRVSSRQEGDMDLDLLVGEEELHVLTLEVYVSHVALVLNLAAARQAVELLLTEMGEEGEEVELPEQLEGQLRLEVTHLGERQAQITAAISQALKVRQRVEGEAIDVSVQPSSLVLDADGDAGTMNFDLSMGAVNVAMPFQLFMDGVWADGEGQTAEPIDGPWDDGEGDGGEEQQAPQVAGRFSAHFAGGQLSASLSGESETFTFQDIQFGNEASWVKRDEVTLVELDLNAERSRRLESLRFWVDPAQGDEALPQIAVRPALGLELSWGLRELADEIEDLPGFLLSETWALDLAGSDEPTVQIRDDRVDEDTAIAIELVAGTLSLSSTATDDVLVHEGMCLAAPVEGDEMGEGGADDEGDEGPEHPLSGLFEAACP